MVTKDWKKRFVKPNRTLWSKGDVRFGDFIYLDKMMGMDLKMWPNVKYQVGARRKISKQTENGHFKDYKTKSAALSFIRKYLSKY